MLDGRADSHINLCIFMLCPRGLRVVPHEKERERRGWTGLLETIGKGGKDWRANGVLPEGNWRGL